MKITPSLRPQLSAAVLAVLCVGATSGCRVMTIPWEHPTAFKKTPVCDSRGPCGDGCYVPPPPTINSDCYGFRFTCWHPWPEHCQPQCDGESACVGVEPMPVVAPPTAMPETPMPAEPPTAPMPGGAEGQTTMRRNEARFRAAQPVPPVRDLSRPLHSAPTTVHANPAPPNYGYMSAVAESSAAKRDDSVRPASSVTRLQHPPSTNDAPSDGTQDRAAPTHRDATRDGLERFRW